MAVMRTSANNRLHVIHVIQMSHFKTICIMEFNWMELLQALHICQSHKPGLQCNVLELTSIVVGNELLKDE